MANSNQFETDERRARAEAEELWRADGSPEGGPERYLDLAREIIALKDSSGATRRPVADTVDELAEPPLAVESQGDMPGLDDLASSEHAPSRDVARENAETRPLSVEADEREQR